MSIGTEGFYQMKSSGHRRENEKEFNTRMKNEKNSCISDFDQIIESKMKND